MLRFGGESAGQGKKAGKGVAKEAGQVMQAEQEQRGVSGSGMTQALCSHVAVIPGSMLPFSRSITEPSKNYISQIPL